MKDNKICFGIIGCGLIANWHANAINAIEGAELIGVVDSYKQGAIDFADKYKVKVFETLENMFSDKDIDVVCICTPSGLHAPQAIMAAKAGKHVIVEKPMALNVEQADEVIKTCEDNGVKMAVISQLRFADTVVKVKNAIDSGLLGRIVAGDVYMKYYRSQEYYNKGGWRGTWKMDGGGALMNQGIHGVDLLRYIMGPVKTVSAFTRTLARKIEVEDTASAIVEFASGALGVIQATTSVSPGYPRRIEISGDKGTIVLEEGVIARWDIEGQGKPEDVVIGKAASGSASNPADFDYEGHILQINDMIEAIKTDRNPMVTHYDGRKPVQIITSIYESSRNGKPVELAGN